MARGKKKRGCLIPILVVVVLIIVAAALSGGNNDNGTSTPKGNAQSTQATDNQQSAQSTDMFNFASSDIQTGEQDINGLEVKFGELLSVNCNGDAVVVKVKITPSYNNNATIDQNYYNVEDLIKEHGFNTCQELQYWAVADMSNGDESKCISFTLDKQTIDALYDGSIVANELSNYVSDLWVLPSLQE